MSNKNEEAKNNGPRKLTRKESESAKGGGTFNTLATFKIRVVNVSALNPGIKDKIADAGSTVVCMW